MAIRILVIRQETYSLTSMAIGAGDEKVAVYEFFVASMQR
jgi:hypothetical protein